MSKVDLTDTPEDQEELIGGQDFMAEPIGPPFGIVLNGHSLVSTHGM